MIHTGVTQHKATTKETDTIIPVNISRFICHRLKKSLNSSISPVITHSKPPICNRIKHIWRFSMIWPVLAFLWPFGPLMNFLRPMQCWKRPWIRPLGRWWHILSYPSEIQRMPQLLFWSEFWSEFYWHSLGIRYSSTFLTTKLEHFSFSARKSRSTANSSRTLEEFWPEKWPKKNIIIIYYVMHFYILHCTGMHN